MLSPVKIILIILVLIGVFFAHRFYRSTIAPSLDKARKNGNIKGRSGDKMLDLEECPDCGAFVADLDGHRCKDK
ncbi:hypothetical protein GQF03_07515 [Sneathiella chungangensis]|uniref:Uncharacterized protein n=1 Tax=Sneathiella chungangensis TaxID=1418234 RepID=A0A845MDQ1_9PROT|nr:hypothetical protein [Sneathiella chungangensis]MZR22173.1 hypothetical protein [Sneathiella chungangensis]